MAYIDNRGIGVYPRDNTLHDTDVTVPHSEISYQSYDSFIHLPLLKTNKGTSRALKIPGGKFLTSSPLL